jgi:hypothetical protein
MTGYVRITRKQFYLKGNFVNARLVRRQEHHCWAYYERLD